MENENKTIPKVDGTPIDILTYEGTVDEDYIPEGFDSVADFLCDMRENYELDLEADRPRS